MRKAFRIGIIGLLFLLYFNISTLAASDYNPWELQRESAQEIVQTIQTYFHEASIKSEQEWEKRREERAVELGVWLDREKSQTISDIWNYGRALEAQLDHVLAEQSVQAMYAAYEIERNKQLHVEMEEEIVIILDELLSTK